MPTQKEMVQNILLVKDAYRSINHITSLLNKDEFQELNEENKIVVGQINKILIDAKDELNGMHTKIVRISSIENLERIERLWSFLYHFSASEDLERLKVKYKKTLEATKNFCDSLCMTPLESFINTSFRNKSSEDEQARLESLSKKRLEVKQLYEKALKEVPINVEKIKELKEQLDALGETYVETKKNLDGIKTDSAVEIQMRKRIDEAFAFLSKDNHLEDEIKKLRKEFYTMLGLIASTVILFFAFYGWFLYHIESFKLKEWCDYLPYTMAVPITIGLLWLFVYLKNRASKISIELSSQLYNIGYLEGLMKMTNSMSRTSDEAFQNIEELIHSMVDSFLKKMSDKPLKEKDLSQIEKQELENSPYWKVLVELKQLVNLIKNEPTKL